MKTIVRRAIPADAPAACAVLRRSIAELCAADHQRDPAILEAWLANKTVENVRHWIESPDRFTVVAERDGRVVGVAQLVQSRSVSLCYLVPEVLHQGVGRAMLAALEAEARARGMSAVGLSSTRTAHAFYARQGYVDTGKSEAMFGLVAHGMRKEFARRA